MLSANTAWLVLNTTKKPMDDPAFRQALAHAIDVNKIVTGVYGQIVQAASPTGLLPAWDKFVDKSVVSSASATTGQGAVAAGRRRLQGHQRRRFRRGAGRSQDRARPHRPQRLDGLDGVDPGRRRERQGRRHQGQHRVPRVPGTGRRPQQGRLRHADQQREAALQLALGVLRLHVPAAGPGLPEHGQLGRYENKKAWTLSSSSTRP